MSPENPPRGAKDRGSAADRKDGPRRAALRIRRRWKTAALLLILLAVIGASIGLRARLDGWVREALERAVRERTGGELSLGTLHLQWTRLQAEFSDVELRVPLGENEVARVAIARGRARVAGARSLLGLPAGRLHLADLVLERPLLEWTEPPSRGEGVEGGPPRRPIDLRVDHLELRHGIVVYEDREVPWSLSAGRVALSAKWNPRTRALIGEAALRAETLRDPFVQPLPLDVYSRFKVRRHDIEIDGLVAQGTGIEGTLEGNLRLSDSVTFVGRGELKADVDRLRPLLDPSLVPVEGRLSGAFSVESGGGTLKFRSEVTGESLRLGGLQADRAQATARYAGGVLQLVDLRANAFGGEVSGTVKASWDGEQRFQVDLSGEDLDGRAMLERVGLQIPVASRVDIDLLLEGAPGEPRSWAGEGAYLAYARPGSSGELPMDSRGDFQIDGGILVSTAELELAAARCSSRVTVDLDLPGEGTLEFDGGTVNARDTQAAVLRIAEALELVVPDAVRRPLGGAGTFQTRIRSGSRPRVELALDLSHGRYGERRFDRAELELDVENENLRVARFVLEREAARLTGSGLVQLEPLSVVELELDSRGVEAAWLLSAAEVPAELTGPLDATLTVRQEEDGRHGSGEVRIAAGRLYGEPFEQFAASLRIEPGIVHVDDWSAAGPVVVAGGDFTWWTADERWELALDQARIRLEGLEAFRSRELPIEGGLELDGSVRGGTADLKGDLVLVGTDWGYGGRPIGDARGVARFDGQGLTARLDSAEEGKWTADVALGWMDDLPLEARITLDGWLLEFGAGEPAPVWAVLSGEAEVETSLLGTDPPRARGRLAFAEIHSGLERLETAEPVDLSLENGRLGVSELRWIGPDTDLRITGNYDVGADDLAATLAGHLDLGLLTAALPEIRAWGDVDVTLEARGPLAGPALEGSLACTAGRLRWLGFPQSVDQLDFLVRFEGRQAELRRLRGRFGTGEVQATGEAVLRGSGSGSYTVRVDAANVRVGYPEGFRGVYEGQLTIEGTEEQATVGGQVTMLLGEYTEDFDLTGASTRAYAVPDDEGLPDSIFLDLVVSADGNVWVRNEIADLESSFELHLGGSLRRPEVTGRIWALEGGELVYRDVEYRVTSGSLDFVELERLNPYLTLRAETTVKEYSVFLRVEGTLDRFEYELTSDPPLATPDIIVLLTTGDALEWTAMSSSSASFTGDVAANYFSGALTGPFERQLERVLGLEKVRIDPLLAEGESDPTTRITLGEEVADDLFVIFSTEFGGTERQLYEVDWRATRRFHFGVQRDTQGGVGGDVRYTRSFWLRSSPEKEEAVAEAASTGESNGPGASRVTGVRFEGIEQDDLAAIERRVSLRPGDSFSRSAMFGGVEAIKRYYVRRDQIETRVDASTIEGGSGTEVVYRITPSMPVQVSFVGTTSKENRRMRPVLERLWIESVFAEELYDDAVDLVRDTLQERGFYAADVRLAIADDGEVRQVVFHVDRGKPVRVEKVTLRGVEQLQEEPVRSRMMTRPSTLLARRLLVPQILDQDVSAIRALYRDEGFLAVRVEAPRVLLSLNGETAEIEIEIHEKERYRVESATYPDGLSFSAEEMAGWAAFPVGEFFSPAGLLQAESRLRAGIDARGYPDARVRGRFQADGTEVDVRFEIDAGEPKRVGELRVSGNRLSKDKIILREVELESGDEISREKLLQSQHRLYQLGIFRNVRFSYQPIDSADPVLQRLEVAVEESPPLMSSLGVGYDTEADARLSFSLSHQNLGGYDRVLAVQGKYSGLERRLQLVGQDPRLFARKLPALVSVGWEEEQEEDFTVERVTTALRVDRSLTPKWTAYGRYNLQRVDLSDVEITPEELEEEKLVEGRLGDVGIAFVRDTRDNPFLARKGSYATVGGRLFAKALASEFTFVKSNLSWSGVRTSRGGHSVASSVRIGLAFPFGADGTVPISEAFFAGGDSTLRGFPRDEVGPASGGESMLLLNQEYRFPIGWSLKGVLFYDTGNVWAETADFDPTDLRHVLGAGVRLETPIGPLRVEYGRKLDREDGESGGELFLAIGSAF